MNLLLFATALLGFSGETMPPYEDFISKIPIEEQQILVENEIDNYDELNEFLASKSSGNSSGEIVSVKKHLLEKYPDYIWVLEEDFETKDVSGANPINVQGKMFPESDVLKVVELSGVASDYGGCGPIAMMGIMITSLDISDTLKL